MPITILNRFLNHGHQRSVKAKKNILASFLVKGISIVTMFLLVPLLINQLSPQKYGIWLTLASFISWFTFLDVGLGNGLKNILAERLALNDLTGAKKAISTAYISFGALTIFLLIIFLIGNQFLNWSLILNAPPAMQNELHLLIIFVVFSFFMQLILRLISSIYDAIQMPAVSGAITGFGNVITILLVCAIIFFTNSKSLVYYGIAISISPLITLIIATIYFFKKKNPLLSPNINYFDKSLVKSMFGLGGKFFLIQITSILLLQTNNFVIAHVVNSNAVTIYDIVYKYSSISQMIFIIMITPLWVASREAYFSNNIEWIHNVISKLSKVILVLCLLSILQFIFSQNIYLLWIGSSIRISHHLTLLMLLYFVMSLRIGLYTMILNGIGKIKIQFYLLSLQSMIHIPLAITLGNKFGIIGVVFSMTLMSLINFIVLPWQCKKILAGNATGIWNE